MEADAEEPTEEEATTEEASDVDPTADPAFF
jgi:hypothetical protein